VVVVVVVSAVPAAAIQETCLVIQNLL